MLHPFREVMMYIIDSHFQFLLGCFNSSYVRVYLTELVLSIPSRMLRNMLKYLNITNLFNFQFLLGCFFIWL